MHATVVAAVAVVHRRINASLSMRFAMRGRSSEMWTPGTLVLMEENAPRISEGASAWGPKGQDGWAHRR